MKDLVRFPIIVVPIHTLTRLDHTLYPLFHNRRDIGEILRVWDKAIDSYSKIYGVLRLAVGRRKSFQLGILLPTDYTQEELLSLLSQIEVTREFKMRGQLVKGYNPKWVELIVVKYNQPWWLNIWARLP